MAKEVVFITGRDPSQGKGGGSSYVRAHAPWLAASIERFLAPRVGPHLIHGFYTWGCVGLKVQQQLRRKGRETVVVSSVYTTASNETRVKTQGAYALHRRFQRLVFQAEHFWINHVVKRYERRAYTHSHLVLLNYESVRRLFLADFVERFSAEAFTHALGEVYARLGFKGEHG
jgi:hypothetical protein